MDIVGLLDGYEDLRRLVISKLNLASKRNLIQTCKKLYLIVKWYVKISVCPSFFNTATATCKCQCGKTHGGGSYYLKTDIKLSESATCECDYGHRFIINAKHTIADLGSIVCPYCSAQAYKRIKLA